MEIVIVSGGSSGIGKACVEKFLKENYFVYNFDIVNNNDFELYGNYKWYMTDVSNHLSIKESVSKVIKKHKFINILIVSAGKHLSANIENTSNDQLMELININILGAFWLIKAVITSMKENKKGKIITIGSDQCSIVKYNSTVYGITKTALLSLTKSIALDYAKYNIRANCIGAGTIDTPLYRNAINKYAEKSGLNLEDIEIAEAREQPIGRIGMPEEIANLAYFLAQDLTDFITGALIPIDGGYIAK